MDFLVNDLSIAGQFPDLPSFRRAVDTVMRMRSEIRRAGFQVVCHRNLAAVRVTRDQFLKEACQCLQQAERRALLQWLTTQGPFWEDRRVHDASDWYEVGATIVTDTAIGEAAAQASTGRLCELVSFDPSDWLHSPVIVTRVVSELGRDQIAIPNHWAIETINESLARNRMRPTSWQTVAERVRGDCPRLRISNNAFSAFDGHPFVPGAAERIIVLFHVLNQVKGCFDESGQRTAEGHRLINEYFTGDKAWFSDESDANKKDFDSDLTFPHPDRPGQYLKCTWHGKVKTSQIRIHFSWPIRPNSPLFVVYVGPKITKR